MPSSADNPNRHAISSARPTGRDTTLTLRGCGEEQAMLDIRSPFVGDGWWYPRNPAWELKAKMGAWEKAVGNNQIRLDDVLRSETK